MALLDNKLMKIAIIGTKGIPAQWGGIEKYVEEVTKRLAAKGHEITVFGSRWYCGAYKKQKYCGIQLKRVPALKSQAVDALSNAFWATLGILAGDFQVAHFHGYASYFFIPILKAAHIPTIVTAHGVESGWDNPKYGPFAKTMIKTAFKTGVTKADLVTTVAEHLKKDIGRRYGVQAHFMPSGMDEAVHLPAGIIKEKFGLNGRDYILFVGRIDPIKRVHWMLDLVKLVPENIKIVISGGAQNFHTQEYFDWMRARVENYPQVIFTGPVEGEVKTEIFSNCLFTVSPSQYEGLPITLLEAASYGRCSLASDISGHKEVIVSGETGFLFNQYDKEDFINHIQKIVKMDRDTIDAMGAKAGKLLLEKYNWQITADKYEKLYHWIVKGD